MTNAIYLAAGICIGLFAHKLLNIVGLVLVWLVASKVVS